jgi:hypothetical protein
MGCGVHRANTAVQAKAVADAVAKTVMQNPQACVQAQVNITNINININMQADNFSHQANYQVGSQLLAQQQYGCGCIPQPQVNLSGPPAGKGLQKNPAGWPEGSVRTAGGYTIVPEGKQAAWSVYGPDQKPGDKPNTRVWGDPHVKEKDGTKWDFTKSSDFVLPDGTRIAAQTTSETGHSVTKGLNITNGADRVSIDGIDKNRPTTSAVMKDGYQWRSQHMASNPGRDTFRLGGDANNVKWFKDGAGLITGASYNRRTKQYEQKTCANQQYWVAPEMRPPVGSAAWGNMLRNQTTDQMAQFMDPFSAQMFGHFMQNDHIGAQVQTALRDLAPYGAFGGLYGLFNGWGQASNALQNLGDAMLSRHALNAQLLGFRASALVC